MADHHRQAGEREAAPAVFHADALREAAVAKTGLSDFGSDSYLTALAPLLQSMEHEAQLNAIGRREIFDRIVAALANRLTVIDWEKANPEAARAPIVQPVFILGLGRTGSSILHETLAAAPGMRTPLIWQVRDFRLVRQVGDPKNDARIQAIDADIARKNQVVEGYAAIHYEDAFIPMECVMLTILDLVSVQFSTIAWAPTYRDYLARLDPRPVYAWHKRALRYLQGNTPGGRWVLKAPMHSLYIDAMMEAYPDALVVQTHRDPLQVIGSMCSLYETLRRPWSTRTDVRGQALADTEYTAEGVRRAVRYRAAHLEADRRIFDLSFKSFLADQVGTLEKLHAHLGLEFTPAARDAMATYLENRPRDKHGKHSYTLEQFGLTPALIRGLFSAYEERFSTFL